MTNIVTIPVGKGLTIDVDVDRVKAQPLSDASVYFLGLKNKLQDTHASITAKEYPDPKAMRDASLGCVQKALDRLYSGDVRSRGVTTRVVLDPVGKESMRLARIWATPRMDDPAIVAKWTASFGMTERKDILAEAVKRYAAKPETIAKATANVAENKTIVADESDL